MNGAAMKNGHQPEFLYSPDLLRDLDYGRSRTKLGVFDGTSLHPRSPFKVRPLTTDDFDKGYLRLLSQLTVVGDITRDQFLRRFYQMKACPDTYYVTIVEDESTGAVIAAASLVTEMKFIRNTALRGRLEDVVVSDEYRGRQLGKLSPAMEASQQKIRTTCVVIKVVQTVLLLAERLGCYKITLDCKDSLIKFYGSNGFQQEPGNSNTMSIRFGDGSPGTRTVSQELVLGDQKVP